MKANKDSITHSSSLPDSDSDATTKNKEKTIQNSNGTNKKNPSNQKSQKQNTDSTNNNVNRFESNKKYFTICIYALFVITVGAAIIYAIMNLEQTKSTIQNFVSVLSPFIAAFFIAYILNPLVKKLDSVVLKKFLKLNRPKLRKVLSIILAYLLVTSLIGITLFYITPQIANSITTITNLMESGKLTNLYNTIINYLNNLEKHFPGLNIDYAVIQEKINEGIPQLIAYGTNLATNIIPMVYNTSIFLVKGFINIILSIVISCYMLSDKNKLAYNAKRMIYSIMPERKADNLVETASECNTIFTSFIIGKTIDSLIIGVLCFILMSILHLPYTILISVIVGVTNMIPYFGPFIGAIPGILICLVVNPIQALIFAILILALQQFDGLILGPKILGDSTGLKPLWVIFAITIGGAYGGVLGMFLGVPIVAVIAYLLNKSISNKLEKRKIDIDNK